MGRVSESTRNTQRFEHTYIICNDFVMFILTTIQVHIKTVI